MVTISFLLVLPRGCHWGEGPRAALLEQVLPLALHPEPGLASAAASQAGASLGHRDVFSLLLSQALGTPPRIAGCTLGPYRSPKKSQQGSAGLQQWLVQGDDEGHLPRHRNGGSICVACARSKSTGKRRVGSRWVCWRGIGSQLAFWGWEHGRGIPSLNERSAMVPLLPAAGG